MAGFIIAVFGHTDIVSLVQLHKHRLSDSYLLISRFLK
jgi:hypothetical protein